MNKTNRFFRSLVQFLLLVFASGCEEMFYGETPSLFADSEHVTENLDWFTEVTKPNPHPRGTSRGPCPVPRQVVIDKIVAYAPQYGVDTRLALAIVRCESNFNACAVGPTKDVGVFQFIPKTWRYVGAEDKGLSRFDADANIRYGLALLRNEGPRHWMCYTRGMI